MNDPLAPLLADGVIDEVVARLKSGKEADVWLVRHGHEIVAAKVYKARHARNFKNNAAYKEGRQVRNTRTQRAMDRGSRFGQAAAEDAWKAKESDALHRLHAAGVRVPRPVLFFEGVLLMEVVVDAHGHPAPRLIDAQVPAEQAAAMYADLRKQAVGMLACDLIHGDLSPYNVLVGVSGPVIIDLPQVIGAAHNSQAEAFFLRDLQNIQRFFAALDPALRSAEGDAREIWRAYVRRELSADFVPSGRPPEPHRQRRPEERAREAPRGERGHGPQRGPQHGPPHAPQHGAQHGQPEAPQRGQQHKPQEGPPRGPHGQGKRHRPGQGPGRGHPATPGGAPAGHHPPRGRPAPEVIRVVRLDQKPSGAPAGGSAAPGAGGGGEQGQQPGAHRRRRRRHRGGGR
jgi:RIO kinase 1